jgi:predicted GNAT family N-acyltransferase
MNMVERKPEREPRRGSKSVHPLDHLESHRLCGRLTVFTPSPGEIDVLMDRARTDLPGIASNHVVRRVATSNPDSFWAIRRTSSAHGENPSPPRGFATFLMLSEPGVDALIRGTLDRTDPPAALLVGQHQRPAAIYVWLVHAKGGTAPALALVMEKLQAPLYRDIDLVARAVTHEGSQFNDSLGFDLGLWWDGEYYPKFHRYRRARKTGDELYPEQTLLNLRAPYDSYDAGDLARADRISVTVAHSFDDMMKALAIRSVVYFGEQQCPYDEEFDGNDFSASHLIAYRGKEPIGCLRIRYFGSFAKLERVAILPAFRQCGTGTKLVGAAVELCRAKGFGTLYAHAQTRFLPFWERLGFKAALDTRAFVFSDHEYIEIEKDVTPISELLALGADPFVLIRPEGRWDRQGILEKSSTRPAGRYPLVA